MLKRNLLSIMVGIQVTLEKHEQGTVRNFVLEARFVIG